MLQLEIDALRSGYVRCPNRPTRWYAGAQGLPDATCFGTDLVIANDSIQLVRHNYRANTDTVVQRFTTWGAYMAYAVGTGRKSLPGNPPFSNSWD